jgi:outer membrane protein assembly factor BamB
MLTSTIAVGQSWPQFRGPDGQGHADANNVPVRWSETEHIEWKVPVPGRGWSSPVIEGEQLWLTYALNDGRSLHAVCLSAANGDLIHDIVVVAENEPKAIHGKNSHASPTPYIDGEHVYVHFGTYATACIQRHTGQILWQTSLPYEPQHGPGGSPVVFEDLLILNCDGKDVQYVAALDKLSGRLRWKTPRAHISEARRNGTKSPGMAFSTPLIADVAGISQVISAGGDHVAGYDTRTGSELWWSSYDGYSVVPRPIVAHGMAFVSSCYDGPVFYAIRLGGRGDLTESGVAWTLNRGAPHNPSPLAVGDEIYVVADNGIATCLDIHTGQRHWQKRLDGNYSASPLFADGRIYMLNEDGKTTVIRPGKAFLKLAENRVDGRTLASLAPIDNALFLRTDRHLYRVCGR